MANPIGPSASTPGAPNTQVITIHSAANPNVTRESPSAFRSAISGVTVGTTRFAAQNTRNSGTAASQRAPKTSRVIGSINTSVSTASGATSALVIRITFSTNRPRCSGCAAMRAKVGR